MIYVIALGLALMMGSIIAGAALADEPPSPQQQGPCTFGQGAVKINLPGIGDPELMSCQMALLRVDLAQALAEKSAAGALKLKADAEAKAANARADELQKQLDALKAEPKDAAK